MNIHPLFENMTFMIDNTQHRSYCGMSRHSVSQRTGIPCKTTSTSAGSQLASRPPKHRKADNLHTLFHSNDFTFVTIEMGCAIHQGRVRTTGCCATLSQGMCHSVHGDGCSEAATLSCGTDSPPTHPLGSCVHRHAHTAARHGNMRRKDPIGYQ